MSKRYPDVGAMFSFPDCTLVITFLDLTKREGGFKLFDSKDEALNDMHEFSLKQHPQWHKENCQICLEDNSDE